LQQKIGKDKPIDAKIYQSNQIEKTVSQLSWRVEADKSEIIVINDLIKELAGN
jgi:hypothetical protein